MLILPRFWDHSGPTLALGRQIGRRIVDPIECRLLWLLEKWPEDPRGGGQTITFSKENHLFENLAD